MNHSCGAKNVTQEKECKRQRKKRPSTGELFQSIGEFIKGGQRVTLNVASETFDAPHTLLFKL